MSTLRPSTDDAVAVDGTASFATIAAACRQANSSVKLLSYIGIQMLAYMVLFAGMRGNVPKPTRLKRAQSPDE